MRDKAVWSYRVVTAVAVATVACGGMDTTPSPPPTLTTTITITAAGASPRAITVPRGSQVTFVNGDTRRHDMESDPHPEHTDCPEINQVGVLGPGQTRQTGNLTTSRTCGFHDHDDALNNNLRGTITIQ
jgi:plastocyanin